MLNIKKLLTKIMTYMSNYAVYDTVAVSVTINGTYTDTTVSVASAVPSGYKPIAILPAASGSNEIYFYQCRINNATNKTAVVQLKKTTTGSANITYILGVVSVRA